MSALGIGPACLQRLDHEADPLGRGADDPGEIYWRRRQHFADSKVKVSSHAVVRVAPGAVLSVPVKKRTHLHGAAQQLPYR